MNSSLHPFHVEELRYSELNDSRRYQADEYSDSEFWAAYINCLQKWLDLYPRVSPPPFYLSFAEPKLPPSSSTPTLASTSSSSKLRPTNSVKNIPTPSSSTSKV